MKNIRLFPLIVLFLALSGQSFSQQRGEMKAFFQTKNVITVENGKSVSNFQLLADQKQLAAVKESIKNFQSIFTMIIDEENNAEGKYDCKMTFLQPADSSFLMKMLGGMGILKIICGTDEYAINDFLNLK
ncbi:MAG: hypothetical protein NTW49_13275 [Bacteroidia bacterium]|nr:hypothetical protein [Bacteroidia bacterium]